MSHLSRAERIALRIKHRKEYFQSQMARANTPYDRFKVVYSRLLAEFKHLDADLADIGYQEAADDLLEVIERITKLDQERNAS